MPHALLPKDNTFNMLSYSHETSSDYSLFSEGFSLKGLDINLEYKAKSVASLKKIKKQNLILSTGPELVSQPLRKILEELAPTEVEFFDAKISFGDITLHDYSAINILHKRPCCNMEKSEYEITNFDPSSPAYMFLYTVLKDSVPENLNIARCSEQPTLIIINNKLKEHCLDKKLKNISFCSEIDITHKDRSICETV